MQPPALVLPASVSTMVQPRSLIMRSKMSAAAAVSRELKDIPRMAVMMGVALNDVMSTCWTGFLSKAFFFMRRFPYLKSLLTTK